MTRELSTPVRVELALTMLLRTPLERCTLPGSPDEHVDDSSDLSSQNPHDRLKGDLRKEMSSMNDRELELLTLWGEGRSPREIAYELNEPVGAVYSRLKLLHKRILNRMLATMEESSQVNPSMRRFDVFKALQERLQLTAVTASRWQDGIREARR